MGDRERGDRWHVCKKKREQKKRGQQRRWRRRKSEFLSRRRLASSNRSLLASSPSLRSFSEPAMPSPKRLKPQKNPVQAEMQAEKPFLSSRCKGAASAVADRFEPSRVEPRLSPLFLPKSQYLSCQRCCAIAAFANSFLPVVCHLWELRRKKKSFSGKQDAAGREKKRSRPREGVMSVFSSSPSFYFSSRFFAFLFVKAQKIPSDRRWPTH